MADFITACAAHALTLNPKPLRKSSFKSPGLEAATGDRDVSQRQVLGQHLTEPQDLISCFWHEVYFNDVLVYT